MTSRIEVNCATGEVKTVPYTPAEEAAHAVKVSAGLAEKAAKDAVIAKEAAIQDAKDAALEKLLLNDPAYAAALKL